MIVLAIAFLVLMGFSALALDGGHDYLTKRDVQNAADAAALASGKLLAGSGQVLSGPPSKSTSAVVEAANAFAANNGFATALNINCDQPTSTSFQTTWYDAAFDGSGTTCPTATSGFVNKVVVNIPPVPTGGVSIPSDCAGAFKYNCVEVTISHTVRNFLAGVIGFPSTQVAAYSVVLGQPPSAGFPTPPPIAADLYEPASGFTTTGQPSRTNLSCGNCPTFWDTNGTAPTIEGVDGGNITGNVDTVALESNGHMVIQGQTTICDPYNPSPGGSPVTCSQNTATGSLGYAIDNAPTSQLYCSHATTGTTLVPCTTAGPGGAPLNQIWGNQTAYAPTSWAAVAPPVPSVDCGVLVLNGDSVINSESNPDCRPPSTTPYTIINTGSSSGKPLEYQAIVINHGAYEFATGLFYIYGTAPVNTNNTGNCGSTGYTANGIDHCREKQSDFDLCDANNGNGSPTSCPNLTAGVWIGHGGGSFTAATTGTAPSCTGGAAGTDGGGGDATVVSGSGVSFYFASQGSNSTANAFVSTNEVSQIHLTAPALGNTFVPNGLPILFDNENSGFIHLDEASGGGGGFAGIVYQTPTAVGGGVEIDPALAGGTTGALQGQVIAYSLTFYGGGRGVGVDFSNGFGTTSAPSIGTSGRNEQQIIGTPAPSLTGSGNGFETFTLNYTDEWALDGYDVYVKVDGSSPFFFSQGMWDSAPSPNTTLPPQINVPGDNTVNNQTEARTLSQYPASGGSVSGGNGTYTTTLDPATNQYDDWTFTYSNHSTMELIGQWIWGHQAQVSGAQSGSNAATIKYTFPTPLGTTVNIQIFMTDGDHCGDYATANYTFNNIGQPAGGQQSAGSVVIEE